MHLAWLIQPSRDERTTHAVNVEGSPPRVRGRRRGRRRDDRLRVLGRRVLGGAEGPRRRRVVADRRASRRSFYSRHKAAVERILDVVRGGAPGVRVVRLRPGLIFQREAASEIRRLFAGPLLPGALLRRALIPVVPTVRGCASRPCTPTTSPRRTGSRCSATHARGAYNVAAEPVLDGRASSRSCSARARSACPPRSCAPAPT